MWFIVCATHAILCFAARRLSIPYYTYRTVYMMLTDDLMRCPPSIPRAQLWIPTRTAVPHSSTMSSPAPKLHRCPHECGCDYASKRFGNVTRHTSANHPACNPECPSYDPPFHLPSTMSPSDGESNSNGWGPESNSEEFDSTYEGSDSTCEGSGGGSDKGSNKGSDEGSDEGSDSNDSNPPTSQPKPGMVYSRPPNPPRSSRPLSYRTPASSFDPLHRRPLLGPSISKRASLPSRPTASAPARPAAPAKPMLCPLIIQPSLPRCLQSTPSVTQPSPVNPPNLTKPGNTSKGASQLVGKSTPPEKVVDLAGVAGDPNPDGVAATDPSPSQVAEQTVTERIPIEPDSDMGFEATEQTSLSHRGPSRSIKKVPAPVPSQIKRSLKRQRSHPSPNEFSQASSQTPQVDSKPPKRPRVAGPHPPGSTVVLNNRRKHPEFWDLDGTVVLQVDNVLFRVMRSTLSKASPWFRRLFSEELDYLEIMAGCPVYTIEEDLSDLDFANLLRGMENGL